MTTPDGHALRALLEKDIRESRWLMLGLIALLAVSRLHLSESGIDRYAATFLRYAPSLLVVFWGAMNGDPRNPARLFERTHIPVSIYCLRFVSFGFPVAVLLVAVELSAYPELVTGGEASAVIDVLAPLIGLFALSYFVSSVSSQRVALLVGTLAAVFSPLLQPYGLGRTLAWSAAIGSAAAVVLSTAVRGSVRRDISRVLCAAIPVAALIVPSAVRVHELVWNLPREQFVPHTYCTRDGTITVEAVSSKSSGKVQPEIAEFRDLRTGAVYRRTFAAGWHAAGVSQGRRVYILESDPVHHGAKISEWDVKTGTYRVLLRLPLRPDFDTLCIPCHFASIDGSGRYMIARLPAVRDFSVDLWLIDLKKRTGRVVIQDAPYFDPSRARWLVGRVLIPSYRSRIIEVGLPQGTVIRRHGMRKEH